ncbi:MAG TPA: hypothetical protein VNL95_05620 [Dehalococcoidia bacterium]|nr:hypothetical protein [Dehalococcoidia bacterium]
MVYRDTARPLTVAAAACVLLLAVACGGGQGERVGGRDDAQRALREAAQRLAQGQFKITYSATISGGGQPSQGGQMVFYWRPGNFRLDFSAGPAQISLFTSQGQGQIGVMCDHTSRTCAEVTVGRDTSTPFGFDPNTIWQDIPGLLGSGPLQRSSRTIAGQQATCWTGQSPYRVEVCLRNDGALLSLSYEEAGQTFRMEAQRVERPSDADFQPPYPVARG